MPNHNFDSKIDNQHNFESKIENLHRFDSIINAIRYFESIVDGGYFDSNFWNVTFTNAINIVVGTIKSSAKISTPITIGPINFVVNRLLIGLQINQRADFVSNIIISAFPKMAMKFANTSLQISQRIQARMSQLVRVNSVSMRIPQVAIGVTLTARKYYMVNNWDASLLSTLDTMNLVDMDYLIV